MNIILKNKKIITHTLIIASIILLVVISLQSSFATTTPITNTIPGGISTAISTPSPDDIIELDDGTYTVTDNTNIFIDRTIIIQGKTKGNAIIDAQELSRIFTIDTNLNVTFINITFTNGYSTHGRGAIFNPSLSIMTIINCTFINNNANRSGAIYNGAGNLTISNSNFTNNISNAIYNSGEIYIQDSIISNNTSNGVNNGGNATLNGNTIVANAGYSVVNNGNLTGSGNTIDYQTNLTIINTIVSTNKVTITAKAVDYLGDVIIGATINFYVNGNLLGSLITNNAGIPQFTYNASSSGY